MATIVLSAAGMAFGGTIGGSVMGLSMAALGRAAGAAIGQRIDQSLLGGGSDPVETGRIDRFRLTGASEGAPIPRLYGRMRVGGQVIWATRFREHSETSGGGKFSAKPKVTEYGYTVSLAIALCEGEISHVGRIWADGAEVAPDDLNMRVYYGDDDQLPDPLMEAVEGEGAVPSYRGVAYVVIEDLDVTAHGNRIPQFSFEVFRPSEPQTARDGRDIARMLRGVALIPGTGEYSLATTPLSAKLDEGTYKSLNIHSTSAKTDYDTAIDSLTGELPNVGSVSLIVSWFGDDLRCGHCQVQPKVEAGNIDPEEMPWTAGGVTREDAGIVPMKDDRPVYGGTPTDQSVIESIRDLKSRGLKPMFYPFILMEQMEGNALPDPWTGGEGQAVLPWRGRITTERAPGVAGTTDRTSAAEMEVAQFFGEAQVSDFSVTDGEITYTGPQSWGYRRFILHYAHLCAAAGGVDSFCIGSEMRALTQIRGAGDSFPAVDALRQLTRDVRQILGADTKIGYAADWSEYHGYQPVGTGDKYFHLDSLWMDRDIDFIGVDNYLPLSDWRDGEDHLDAHHGAIHDLKYLRSNVEGGEYYDWYYDTPEARDAQRRTEITDGDGEPWVWRAKDFRNWWLNPHFNRVNGQRVGTQTVWEPQSKPIWFTEFGCAAIDKGTNQPNKFLDPKSSESAIPHYSNGGRDDLLQAQYLRATCFYYTEKEHNPTSEVYGGPMIDMTRAHVWAWDARPYPFFPNGLGTWSDGENYARGHWLNGRASSRLLASAVREICLDAGIEDVDVKDLHGIVRGYVVDRVGTARQALQPLMLMHGFDVTEANGTLRFASRKPVSGRVLDPERLVLDDSSATTHEITRAPEAELSGKVRLAFVQEDGSYDTKMAEAVKSDDTAETVAQSEFNVILTGAEGRLITERWLSEARVARDTLSFAVPLSDPLYAGEVVQLAGHHWRVDRIEISDRKEAEAVRVEPNIYEPAPARDDLVRLRDFVAPLPVDGKLLDLPLLSSDGAVTAYFAALGIPWPGSVAIYRSEDETDYALDVIAQKSATIGITETDLAPAQTGILDRGAPLRVRLYDGELRSISKKGLLAGRNMVAIGREGSWELMQFQKAVLVAPNTYELSIRLRGQRGTDHLARQGWQAGARVILLNDALTPLGLGEKDIGLTQYLHFGPADRPLDDPHYKTAEATYDGAALRPYPVAHLRSEGGRVHWIRRSRMAPEHWGARDVPLGEESEAYVVRITRGEDVSETVVNTPEIAVSGPARVDVAQLSASVGAGPFRSVLVA